MGSIQEELDCIGEQLIDGEVPSLETVRWLYDWAIHWRAIVDQRLSDQDIDRITRRLIGALAGMPEVPHSIKGYNDGPQ